MGCHCSCYLKTPKPKSNFWDGTPENEQFIINCTISSYRKKLLRGTRCKISKSFIFSSPYDPSRDVFVIIEGIKAPLVIPQRYITGPNCDNEERLTDAIQGQWSRVYY